MENFRSSIGTEGSSFKVFKDFLLTPTLQGEVLLEVQLESGT